MPRDIQKRRISQKIADAKWYRANKSKRLAANRHSKQQFKTWFNDLRASKCCSRCAESHPACLDFHHLDPKDKVMEVTNMVKKRFSKEKILAEIEKCIILCANCHRKLHYDFRLEDSSVVRAAGS